MPESQSCGIGKDVTNLIDNIPDSTEKQTPLDPVSRSAALNHVRLSHLHELFWSYYLLTVVVLIVTLVAFCITRSPWSFSFLSFLVPLYHLLRRAENHVYPLPERDFILELSKPEKQKMRKRGTSAGSIVLWVNAILRIGDDSSAG